MKEGREREEGGREGRRVEREDCLEAAAAFPFSLLLSG